MLQVSIEELSRMNLLRLFSIVAFFTFCVTAESQEKCPPLYLRYSKIHSYCKPTNATCNILKSVATEHDIQVILKEHNTLRSRIASGKEQKLPTASNMLQMVWDSELSGIAQAYANQCLYAHDCSDCRRVQNYAVGQNLAIECVSNSPKMPDLDWAGVIKRWYDEIAYFSENAIEPFISSTGENTYGHFSQLVWADSWRIGCGYVLYQEFGEYKKLYVCNYGSAGNVVLRSMYKAGAPCSSCPVNSCCDKTCGTTVDYPGLCKITDCRGPTYKPQGTYIFYCDFQNRTDCSNYVIGKNWLIFNTLSGNYVGIVLKGGEESTIVFNNTLKPTQSSFCVVIRYRKGPNVAGQEEGHKAIGTFRITNYNQEVNKDLPDFGKKFTQQFSAFTINLGWNLETEFKVTFSVPPGKPEQFLEIETVYATDGSC